MLLAGCASVESDWISARTSMLGRCRLPVADRHREHRGSTRRAHSRCAGRKEGRCLRRSLRHRTGPSCRRCQRDRQPRHVHRQRDHRRCRGVRPGIGANRAMNVAVVDPVEHRRSVQRDRQVRARRHIDRCLRALLSDSSGSGVCEVATTSMLIAPFHRRALPRSAGRSAGAVVASVPAAQATAVVPAEPSVSLQRRRRRHAEGRQHRIESETYAGEFRHGRAGVGE